jgi:hypothetical protein
MIANNGGIKYFMEKYKSNYATILLFMQHNFKSSFAGFKKSLKEVSDLLASWRSNQTFD